MTQLTRDELRNEDALADLIYGCQNISDARVLAVALWPLLTHAQGSVDAMREALDAAIHLINAYRKAPIDDEWIDLNRLEDVFQQKTDALGKILHSQEENGNG